MNGKNEKIISIQVLRALAVLMVVFIHTISSANYLYTGKHLFSSRASIATYYFLSDWGAIGVDLFFIISGFIMTRVVLPFENVPNGWRNFMLKRIIRIVPYYWLISAVYLVLSILWHQPVTWGAILKTIFFIPVFDKFEFASPILFVGWSLSIELYFYLIIAFFLFLKNKNLKISVIITTSLLSAFGVFLQSKYVIIDFLFSPLLIEFALGIVLGLIYDRFKGESRRKTSMVVFSLLLLAGTFLMGYTIFVEHKAITLPNNVFSDVNTALKRSVIWGIPCMLLATGYLMAEKLLFLKGGLYGKITAPLVLLGDASYSCYLIHLMAIKFFAMIYRYLGITTPDTYIIVCTIVCMIVSVPVYKLIEVRIIKLISPIFYPKKQLAAV
jgi:peptidoglycan/LPS O-acetylase OafA/YrhL